LGRGGGIFEAKVWSLEKKPSRRKRRPARKRRRYKTRGADIKCKIRYKRGKRMGVQLRKRRPPNAKCKNRDFEGRKGSEGEVTLYEECVAKREPRPTRY